MKRRSLLAAAGTTAMGVAGCLAVADPYDWIDETGSRHLSVADGRVIGCRPIQSSDSDAGSDGELFALEAETGDRLWTYGSSGPFEGYANPTVRDGVYTSRTTDVAERPDEIHALEFDGTVRWDDVRGRLEGVADGVAYVTEARSDRDDSGLRALETASGDRLWRRDVTGAVLFDPTASDGHVTVYVDGAELVALERSDGSVRWRYDHGEETRTRTVADGTVYVATDESVAAIADGEERWRRSGTDPAIRGVEAGRLLVEFGDDGDGLDEPNELCALDLETGDERWCRERRGRAYDPVRVDSRDGVVYVADDRLSAVDAADGTERWSNDVTDVESLTVVDGTNRGVDHAVVATTADGTFAMYEPSGERFCTDDFADAIEDVAVAELAFVATTEQVYAFDSW